MESTIKVGVGTLAMQGRRNRSTAAVHSHAGGPRPLAKVDSLSSGGSNGTNIGQLLMINILPKARFIMWAGCCISHRRYYSSVCIGIVWLAVQRSRGR